LWQYYGQKYVFISILKKIDQNLILLLLLFGNLGKESLNCPYKTVQFFTSEPSSNFFASFGILLDAHAVQYEINFDNSVEIHLTYRK
jgi:hypothetical protein